MMAAESVPPVVMLSELLRDLLDVPLLRDAEIHGLAVDSRAVEPGDLFFALQGTREHGLAHLDQALAQGAAAVLWEPGKDDTLSDYVSRCEQPCYAMDKLAIRMGEIASVFHGHPSTHMHCIGVTGTDGKTSVSHFIAQVLQSTQGSCGLIGTLGYGEFGNLQTPTHTTPDALRLQDELANLHGRRVKNLVMEVSSHALDQYRVSGVSFNTAVLTNLSREHLDYHGDMQRYAAVKQRLFSMPGLKTVVLNLDDKFGADLLSKVSHGQRVIAYSVNSHFEPPAQHEWLCARSIKTLQRGMRIELDSSWGAAVIETKLLGNFNAANLLAAAGALLATGMSFINVIHRLSNVTTVPGRMEAFGERHQPLVIVDYAHTPNALQKALQALREHCTGKLICVFGAGGDRDPGKRPAMGAVAEQFADHLIVTSDNPRTEDPESIISMITNGLRQPGHIQRISDRAEAIAAAIKLANENDTVLIAGKGHESYQQVGSQCLPFSDREQVISVLQECKA
jgi:UDP-N-acetylmuramoyl-L-alanyl-D-glutamate--2,6-diaminopimelate ligase